MKKTTFVTTIIATTILSLITPFCLAQPVEVNYPNAPKALFVVPAELVQPITEVRFVVPVVTKKVEDKRVTKVDNVRATLMAIEEIENAKNGEIGRRGERSSFQFLRSVWRKYSSKPFSMASKLTPEAKAEQLRVAYAHYQWITENIENPTPYRIALAWNAGVGAVNRNQLPNQSVAYATRVFNMFHEIKKSLG